MNKACYAFMSGTIAVTLMACGLLAGDDKWTDYILEGRVAIRPAKGQPESGNNK